MAQPHMSAAADAPVDAALIRAEIIAQVTRRAQKNPLNTICPSEVARTLWSADWRTHMQAVRNVAYQLSDETLIEVTQGGHVVMAPASAKGAIRLRKTLLGRAVS